MPLVTESMMDGLIQTKPGILGTPSTEIPKGGISVDDGPST